MKPTARDASSPALALGCGVLFAVGLTVAGMTSPRTILDAFRVDDGSDPRLFLMFAGSLAVKAPVDAWLRRRGRALGARTCDPPAPRVDLRLVAGSVLFGVGWGLGGLCPGPAFTVALTGAPHATVFFLGMTFGFAAWHIGFERRASASLRRPSHTDASTRGD